MKLTTNYSLKKPEGADVVNIEDLNYNADALDNLIKNTANNIGSLSQLKTSSKSNLVSAINEVFQNANNGKKLIANAIGDPVNSNDTFSAMSEDINSLLSKFKTNMTNSGATVSSTDKFSSLIDKISQLSNIKYATGTINHNINKTFVINGETYGITFSKSLDFVPSILIITDIFMKQTNGSAVSTQGSYVLTNLSDVYIDSSSKVTLSSIGKSIFYISYKETGDTSSNNGGIKLNLSSTGVKYYAIGI